MTYSVISQWVNVLLPTPRRGLLTNRHKDIATYSSTLNHLRFWMSKNCHQILHLQTFRLHCIVYFIQQICDTKMWFAYTLLLEIKLIYFFDDQKFEENVSSSEKWEDFDFKYTYKNHKFWEKIFSFPQNYLTIKNSLRLLHVTISDCIQPTVNIWQYSSDCKRMAVDMWK